MHQMMLSDLKPSCSLGEGPALSGFMGGGLPTHSGLNACDALWGGLGSLTGSLAPSPLSFRQRDGGAAAGGAVAAVDLAGECGRGGEGCRAAAGGAVAAVDLAGERGGGGGARGGGIIG